MIEKYIAGFDVSMTSSIFGQERKYTGNCFEDTDDLFFWNNLTFEVVIFDQIFKSTS